MIKYLFKTSGFNNENVKNKNKQKSERKMIEGNLKEMIKIPRRDEEEGRRKHAIIAKKEHRGENITKYNST